MKNFVQPGKTLTLAAPTGGVVSGQLVKIGSIFGVAANTAAETVLFDLEVGGVYDVTKATGAAWAAGDDIYMTSGNVATKTASGNTKIGVAVAAAATGDEIGRVRLNSNF